MVQGYVLHSLAWRETSLIVEAFTREEGRLGLVARGARRPRSPLRGLLQPFQPLGLRYSAKGELRSLMGAEWLGGMGTPSGDSLLAGFYLNELLMRLMPREDPHPLLFDAYEAAMQRLSESEPEVGTVLRWFECRLLREMGVAPEFDTVEGMAVEAAGQYALVFGEPVVLANGQAIAESTGMLVSGHTLLALSRYDASANGQALDDMHAEVGLEAKRLLRGLIRHQLGESGLQSRQAMMGLARLRQQLLGIGSEASH
ncbi:MAG: DNA repair protein RecO [Burkholderiaceae bacterium]